mmetsp:Transcript_32225/g.72386  ORF Transcript_32225/g.72386 Transcript_32225/m.72386 type:complete len:203 (+) Transcript_32225:73-681(+)
MAQGRLPPPSSITFVSSDPENIPTRCCGTNCVSPSSTSPTSSGPHDPPSASCSISFSSSLSFVPVSAPLFAASSSLSRSSSTSLLARARRVRACQTQRGRRPQRHLPSKSCQSSAMASSRPRNILLAVAEAGETPCLRSSWQTSSNHLDVGGVSSMISICCFSCRGSSRFTITPPLLFIASASSPPTRSSDSFSRRDLPIET